MVRLFSLKKRLIAVDANNGAIFEPGDISFAILQAFSVRLPTEEEAIEEVGPMFLAAFD